MKTIGITGGIGTGKTTAVNFFKELGVPVYIADQQAKKLMNSDTELQNSIIELLGKETFIEADGSRVPDRAYIASIVFNDSEKLEQLNAIIHPAVRKDFIQWKVTQNTSYILYEAAILFESGSTSLCDLVILVSAELEERISRVKQRDSISRNEVLSRINNQWTQEKKLCLADIIIDNSGKVNELYKLVKKTHIFLLKL